LSSDAAGLRARRAAYEILLRVDQRGAFADLLLGHRLPAFPVAADRRLITQLVLGTLAWRGRLDFELARISSRELERMTPEILTVLRMALYQIRMLTRIPKHAAVDTAVSLARAVAGPAPAGFVNAILRNAIRAAVALPQRAVDEIGHLAVVYSHPRWLVEKFVDWLGVDGAETLMAANNTAAPNVMRLNLARADADSLIKLMQKDGLRITRRGRLPETVAVEAGALFESVSFREGLFQPQSEASQLVARLLAPSKGALVIDCAGAPGGKASHLAELVGRRGRVIAFDINFAGLKNTLALARRLRHHNMLCVQGDARGPLPLQPGSCKFVLLDAPCTGLGTLREHPEIRWRLKPDDITRMSLMQDRMIEYAATLIAPDGVLVYAVCSIAPDEGLRIAQRFLDRHLDFAVDRSTRLRTEFADLLDDAGFMRTRPDREGLDGFFAARLIRRK